MCGIHCIVDREFSLTSAPIKKMVAQSIHRGQDYTSVQTYQAENYQIFFGHNLLKINSITDKSQQPFHNEHYTLVFNGEIYNWEDLDKKFNFANQSNSDTETLFHYLKLVAKEPYFWGKLKGIFAFVFWDKKRNILLSARDMYGVKPLYFTIRNNFLAFSSEINSLVASGLVDTTLQNSSVGDYLQHKFSLLPNTFFKDIQQHPCHLQTWDLNTKNLDKSSFSVDKIRRTVPNKLDEILTQTNSLLEKAIQNQYSEYFPPALLLSGGVDSTLLLAKSIQLGYQLPCFSIICDEKRFTQDSHFARLAAKQYKTDLHEVKLQEQHLELLPKLFQEADQPIGDGAMLTTYLICKEAKKDFRVLWSGAGADEIFGGYNRHWAFYQYLKHPSFWIYAKKLAQFLPFGRLGKRFLKGIDISPSKTFINFCSLDILENKNTTNIQIQTLDDALKWDREQYLQADILSLTDFWSMKHTIEVRVPYLDDDLANFAKQIPSQMLLKHGRKWILKKLLEQKDGKIYTQRKKEGFGIPFGHWLQNKKNNFLWDFAKNPQNPIFEYVPKARFQYILQKHLSRQEDYTQELFALCALGWWLEKHPKL
ncbi:MAG: asparagine synthase (glutamine-hydrolyzing) [Raineya sp.]|jgi:asparagine synthase (glutamine-hydrolysing)|nr:asparagine synthase (glutamine-hydrolyzing) [Raineya sp.]